MCTHMYAVWLKFTEDQATYHYGHSRPTLSAGLGAGGGMESLSAASMLLLAMIDSCVQRLTNDAAVGRRCGV